MTNLTAMAGVTVAGAVLPPDNSTLILQIVIIVVSALAEILKNRKAKRQANDTFIQKIRKP